MHLILRETYIVGQGYFFASVHLRAILGLSNTPHFVKTTF